MTVNHTTPGVAVRRALFDKLHDVLKVVRVLKSHRPAHHDLIPTGMVGVLAVIDGLSHRGTSTDGCHGKDLALHSALDPSTVSRTVTALVHLGLVRRTADPMDGRANVLSLTPSGRRALAETHRWYDDVLAGALHDWSPEELTAFTASLHRFTEDVLSHLDTSPSSKTLEAAR
jgi:DNA-binding MarR family transcriptional regulator